MTGNRIAQITSGIAICTVLVLSGCSNSKIPTAAPQVPVPTGSLPSGTLPTALPTGSLPAAAGSAIAKILGSGGPLDVSKLCAAVPTADMQKLFKAPVPAVVAFPGECNWGNGAITVDIFFNDGSKQFYNGGAISSTSSKPLSGVGDIAQWLQPVPGMTVPFLSAQKGTTTVTVSPSLDVDQTTMTYTGTAPFFHVPAAAAAQYVAEEGQICNDIFAASNA